MALSLSGDEEDYDSESEQVRALPPRQAFARGGVFAASGSGFSAPDRCFRPSSGPAGCRAPPPPPLLAARFTRRPANLTRSDRTGSTRTCFFGLDDDDERRSPLSRCDPRFRLSRASTQGTSAHSGVTCTPPRQQWARYPRLHPPGRLQKAAFAIASLGPSVRLSFDRDLRDVKTAAGGGEGGTRTMKGSPVRQRLLSNWFPVNKPCCGGAQGSTGAGQMGRGSGPCRSPPGHQDHQDQIPDHQEPGGDLICCHTSAAALWR